MVQPISTVHLAKHLPLSHRRGREGAFDQLLFSYRMPSVVKVADQQ